MTTGKKFPKNQEMYTLFFYKDLVRK